MPDLLSPITETRMVAIPPQTLKNHYKSIADHKDVAKIVMMLTSAVNSFRADMANALQQFSGYHFLWEEDREKAVQVSARCTLTV